MRVAAYQAPLLPGGSTEAIALIRKCIDTCEAGGVEILCCPEAVLGGLADDAARPADVAIDVESGQLEAVLTPLASSTVTTIVGFTEIAAGHLYNSAAVFHRGAVAGVYRKLYPAIRKSVYRAGDRVPVFAVGDLVFGIVICNDSNYPETTRILASRGAAAVFVPTNNSLPPEKADVVAEARAIDVARAKENGVSVIRADVAGRTTDRVSYGSSCIVDPDGTVLRAARPLAEDLLIAEIDVAPRGRRRGPSVQFEGGRDRL